MNNKIITQEAKQVDSGVDLSLGAIETKKLSNLIADLKSRPSVGLSNTLVAQRQALYGKNLLFRKAQRKNGRSSLLCPTK